MTTTIPEFEPEYRAAVDYLRAALLDLYASVGADPASPQDVARRFRVNKTLTWNISKVVGAKDPLSTIANVPGASAMQSLLAAVQREGASKESVDRVRSAVKELDKTVARHVGDRATLELLVDGSGRGRADHLELSRKLAFRGNSGLWGVQAKVRLMTVFLAPNADAPDRIDVAIVRGYLGLRRLRADVRWPAFQVRGWGNEADAMTAERWQPLEEHTGESSTLPLLQQFSTIAPSDLQEIRGSEGINYWLAPGRVGNAGAVDCFVADCARSAASRYRTDRDATGEFGATISAPTERLIFDLIVHEDLAFALTPEVKAFGGIFMEHGTQTAQDELLPIPVPQDVVHLPGRPLAVATPNVPRYGEIVRYVHERMKWNPERFRGCRFELRYPPLGSTVLLRFELPSRPAHE